MKWYGSHVGGQALFLDPYIVARKLLEWVEEDAPFGDLATGYTVPQGLWARAVIV